MLEEEQVAQRGHANQIVGRRMIDVKSYTKLKQLAAENGGEMDMNFTTLPSGWQRGH